MEKARLVAKKQISTWVYLTGYIFSLVLTFEAYFLVRRHDNSHHSIYSHNFLVATIMGLAIVQLFVQLIYFLHLDKEPKPRIKLAALLFAAVTIIIVVFGSIWIMENLDYHHGNRTQTEINKYIRSQSDL
jgi:cytochrome o ubiquinol oxidase operon protein cyoD